MPRRDLYHFGTAYHYDVNGTVFIVCGNYLDKYNKADVAN
jgi:hypothetical protein